jgi:hypothetical protein
MGVLEGPPQIKTYDAILVQTAEGRAVGAS